MSEILMKVILTGDKEEIEPLSAEELALRDESIKASAKAKIEADAKATQAATDKAALLAKLGITADEAKLLLS